MASAARERESARREGTLREQGLAIRTFVPEGPGGFKFDYGLGLLRKSDGKMVAEYFLYRPVVDRKTGEVIVLPGYHEAAERGKGYGKILLGELLKILSATAFAAKKTLVHHPVTTNQIVLKRLQRLGYAFTGVRTDAGKTKWLFEKRFEPGGGPAFGAEHSRAAKKFLTLLR